jgi:hypothetical protein
LFVNNTAHSIDGFKGSGNGGLFLPDNADPETSKCMEVSGLKAYKTMIQGAFSFFKYKSLIYSNMVMIDNGKGLGALLE